MDDESGPLSTDESAEAGALDEGGSGPDLERSGSRTETAEGGALDEEDGGAQ